MMDTKDNKKADQATTLRHMDQHKKHKRYRDMMKERTKIEYNIIGEPRKVQVKLKGQFRKEPTQCCKSNDKGMSNYTKTSSTIKIPDSMWEAPTLDSLSDVHKSTSVLRQVILAKLMKESPRTVDAKPRHHSMHEILSEYCHTAYGATSIAESRISSLLCAISDLRGFSSFLRVTSRMLDLEDATKLPEDLCTIFFDVWLWIYKGASAANNSLNGVVDIGHQGHSSRRTSDHKRQLLSRKDLLHCFHDVFSASGRSTPPALMEEMVKVIWTQPSLSVSGESGEVGNQHENEIPANIAVNCSVDNSSLLDIDDAVERVLGLIENHDNMHSMLVERLFSMPYRVITQKMSSHLPTQEESTELDMMNALSRLKMLIDAFLLHDENRVGLLPPDIFCHLTAIWADSLELAFDETSIEKLSRQFVGNDVEIYVRYLDFIASVYGFIFEFGYIPDGPSLASDKPRRGIDIINYEDIETYCKRARDLEKQASVFLTNYYVSDYINRKHDEAISTTATYPQQTKQYKYIRAKSFAVKSSCNVLNTNFNRDTEERPKTALHLVEPSFTAVKTGVTSAYLRPKNPVISLSYACDDQDFRGLDHDNEDTMGTNIYIRFPDIEPLRIPIHGKSDTMTPKLRQYQCPYDNEEIRSIISSRSSSCSHLSEDISFALHKNTQEKKLAYLVENCWKKVLDSRKSRSHDQEHTIICGREIKEKTTPMTHERALARASFKINAFIKIYILTKQCNQQEKAALIQKMFRAKIARNQADRARQQRAMQESASTILQSYARRYIAKIIFGEKVREAGTKRNALCACLFIQQTARFYLQKQNSIGLDEGSSRKSSVLSGKDTRPPELEQGTLQPIVRCKEAENEDPDKYDVSSKTNEDFSIEENHKKFMNTDSSAENTLIISEQHAEIYRSEEHHPLNESAVLDIINTEKWQQPPICRTSISDFPSRLLLLDKWDWPIFFDCNERCFLRLGSKFFRVHNEQLFLYRSRHKLSEYVLSSAAESASIKARKHIRRHKNFHPLSGRAESSSIQTRAAAFSQNQVLGQSMPNNILFTKLTNQGLKTKNIRSMKTAKYKISR